jgi:HrpA-like RNA helicase
VDFSKIQINKDLPIAQFEDEIISKFESSSNMIIIGETGSGKTTQIPIMILKSLSKIQNVKREKIAVTEPRRLAATSVAKYVSELIGDDLGKTVGYKIRFNENISDDTQLVFVTDGILLREAQLDPLLLNYSVVMVDEAHERNINSDFLIGLLVDTQKRRKDQGVVPLKILVTSATLEKDKFVSFFSSIQDESLGIVEVPGRLFPITSEYADKEVWEYELTASRKVEEIVRKGLKGDVLIFMPGKREIEKTKEAIEALPGYEGMNLEIITVHANLPIEEQSKIFKKSEKRKIVIATNIAETSLTVPGIVHVIDTGLIKQMEFNPHTGLNSLITKHHAKKGLEQRKGRAGRVEPGFYHALYTMNSYNERLEFQVPEILRTSLAQVVLIMKRIGIDDIETFKLVDTPDPHLVHNAMVELQRLGALDNNQNITEKGLTMASLPLEPRLANLIIEAEKNRCIESIVSICSFLELKPVILNLNQDYFFKKLTEGEDPEFAQTAEAWDAADQLYRDYIYTTRKLEYRGSDFLTILKIWHLWIEHEMRPEWAEHNYLSQEVLDEATNIREELMDIVRKTGYSLEDQKGNDLDKRIERTFISAFKYNLLVRQKSGSYKNIRSGEAGIRLHNSSVLLANKPFYAIAFEVIEIAEIDAEPKLSARLLHSLDENLIRQFFPDIFRKYRRNEDREGRFKKMKFRNDRFGDRERGGGRGGRSRGGRRGRGRR